MFKYFTEGFDFYQTYLNCLSEEDGVKTFEMPVRDTDVLAFVYSLLREINFNKFQLTDMLDYFTNDKNYDVGYKAFCQAVILPFKSFTYQIGMQVINNVQIVEEVEASSSSDEVKIQPSKNVENIVVNTEEDLAVEGAKTDISKGNGKITLQRNIYRLIDLDRLAIIQSHISRDDKEELIYVLESFNKYLLEGDVEKIGLAYQVYYYALRPYKKIKTNIKSITEILVENNILG